LEIPWWRGRATDVYGRLAEAKEAGHIAGSAELQLELTRIVIDGKDYPVVSSDYTLQGKGRGANTAKKVGGWRGWRAPSSGRLPAAARARRSARVFGSAAGAGVQVFTRGQQVKVPSETLAGIPLATACNGDGHAKIRIDSRGSVSKPGRNLQKKTSRGSSFSFPVLVSWVGHSSWVFLPVIGLDHRPEIPPCHSCC